MALASRHTIPPSAGAPSSWSRRKSGGWRPTCFARNRGSAASGLAVRDSDCPRLIARLPPCRGRLADDLALSLRLAVGLAGDEGGEYGALSLASHRGEHSRDLEVGVLEDFMNRRWATT